MTKQKIVVNKSHIEAGRDFWHTNWKNPVALAIQEEIGNEEAYTSVNNSTVYFPFSNGGEGDEKMPENVRDWLLQETCPEDVLEFYL